MQTIGQKVSYVRGLADGLDIKEDTKEGKVLRSIVDVLGDIAEAIDDLESAQSELNEYVNAMDQDLSDVEDKVNGREKEDDDSGFIEVECPNCHEKVYLDGELFEDEDEEIICPNCHEPIHFECECCGDTSEGEDIEE
ncbi:MAG: hypothetical protein QME45_05690 [Clostridiales bacterium]|nr:hypothetical protein [Clostridiales bacterium]